MARAAHVGTRGMPRAEREAQILAAATAEFGERGYHRVSVDAVAARAGISKPLVHAYFGTKDALYVRCAEELTETLLAEIRPVVERAEPGIAMALDTMRTIFTTLRDRPRAWMVLYDETLPPGTAVHGPVAACRDRMTDLGAVGVRAALAVNPAPVDPLDVSAMNHVWQSVVTALMTWWFDHPDQTPEELTARFGRLLTALASAPPG
ncbi:TetR/AcrR family transcriptional regulator [Nocardioides sp. SYSU D00038]|uniref:TetR/AcrR family transcriptional regulator n=1 Tax=Nocardioides sp. SYSU D00038 TaxID=2812554 RepID=UPI001966E022|nr:TetR/AcrR family transcriptional regulator [Nocardioides sp. SYSU D00038]